MSWRVQPCVVPRAFCLGAPQGYKESPQNPKRGDSLLAGKMASPRNPTERDHGKFIRPLPCLAAKIGMLYVQWNPPNYQIKRTSTTSPLIEEELHSLRNKAQEFQREQTGAGACPLRLDDPAESPTVAKSTTPLKSLPVNP